MTVRAGHSTADPAARQSTSRPIACTGSVCGARSTCAHCICATRRWTATCRVLSVTPLLRELILRVVDWVTLDSRNPEQVRLLAEGRSVTDAALDSGYSSLSAFVAAFKKTYGCTPGRL